MSSDLVKTWYTIMDSTAIAASDANDMYPFPDDSARNLGREILAMCILFAPVEGMSAQIWDGALNRSLL